MPCPACPSTPAARTVSPLLSWFVLCLSHSVPGVQLLEVKEAIALWGWFMAGTCIPAFDCGINCFQGLFVSFEV